MITARIDRDITIMPVGDRRYIIPHSVTAWLDIPGDGTKMVRTEPGFEFDGRSGGVVGDLIAPNLGTQEELKCWWMHDVNGYGQTLTFEETNDLLYDMLRDIGYGRIRAGMIHTAVSMSDSWFGEPTEDQWEYRNNGKIYVRHYAHI